MVAGTVTNENQFQLNSLFHISVTKNNLIVKFIHRLVSRELTVNENVKHGYDLLISQVLSLLIEGLNLAFSMSLRLFLSLVEKIKSCTETSFYQT